MKKGLTGEKKDDVKTAFANLKNALGGAGRAVNELIEFVESEGAGGINVHLDESGGIDARLVEANGSIRPNANDIVRKVLEDELKNLEATGSDEARIKKLRDTLKR